MVSVASLTPATKLLTLGEVGFLLSSATSKDPPSGHIVSCQKRLMEAGLVEGMPVVSFLSVFVES